MRKILVIALLLGTYSMLAQIGVNTTDVTSTLTVNGSISGKYIEVRTSLYQIQGDDYNIAYTGSNETTGVFKLPEVKKGNYSFAGRMYYIKNLTKDKNLIVMAYPGQLIRFGGSTTDSNYVTLAPGRYIAIVANNYLGNISWDINMLGMSEEIRLPEIKTLEYTKKTVPLDENTTTASTLKIGNLNVRFSFSSTASSGWIQYMLEEGEYTTTWFMKSGAGVQGNGALGRVLSCYSANTMQANKWRQLCDNSPDDNLSTVNRDAGVAYITLNNKQEVYRVTTSLNSKINANTNLNIPEAPAMVTLFVEKLD